MFIALIFWVFNVTLVSAQQSVSYVDLGLPSGTLWATCNVGAANPWEFGDYFAWGEIKSKTNYSMATYKYAAGRVDTYTKYCPYAFMGYNGFTDNLTILQSSDDAASVNMGSNWKMPTREQYQELIDNCDYEWTSNYGGTGIKGAIFRSRKYTYLHIFFPMAGYYWKNERKFDTCHYWSSSGSGDGAEELHIDSNARVDVYLREYGLPVRAVRR